MIRAGSREGRANTKEQIPQGLVWQIQGLPETASEETTCSAREKAISSILVMPGALLMPVAWGRSLSGRLIGDMGLKAIAVL